MGASGTDMGVIYLGARNQDRILVKEDLRQQGESKRAVEALREQEWRVLTVWECALRGPGRPHLKKILRRVESFLEGTRKTLDLTGS